MNPSPTNTPFTPTRWTLILRSRGETPEARAALSELCEAYYQPVFLFLRRDGRDEDAARELTQEFFARVLKQGTVGEANPGQGRSRSYLLGAVKHFLIDCRRREMREKRGGGVPLESLEAHETEGSVPLEITDNPGPVPDTWFDRQWALKIMERALATVEYEFKNSGKAEQFEVLKPWIAGEPQGQAEAARRLGMNEGAVKVAIHRLRKHFRERVRTEVAQTVSDGGDVDAELRYLVEVLA